MKKSIMIVLAVLVSLVFIGCGDPSQPPRNLVLSGGGAAGAGGDIPGSVGLTLDDIDKSYVGGHESNTRPNRAGMRLVNISGAVELAAIKSEVTTMDTLGLWPNEKFYIEGYNASFNGGFQNAGFNEVSILYYDQLLEGEFTFSARIRMKRVGGVSTGKGIHFGTYSNMGRPDHEWMFGQGSKGFGMFLRAESAPQFRLYYSDGVASTTAGTNSFGALSVTVGKEFIYEVARHNITPLPGDQPAGNNNSSMIYTYKLFDSKTGAVLYDSTKDITTGTGSKYPAPWGKSLIMNTTEHPHGTAVEMSQYLKGPVYAGICISGSSAEISQIRLWTKADINPFWNHGTDTGDETGLVYKTPYTIPAYVPANYIEKPALNHMTILDPYHQIYSPYNKHDFNCIVIDGPNLQTLIDNFNSIITLNPPVGQIGFSPTWADEKIGFEYYYLGVLEPGMQDIFSISGDTVKTYTGGFAGANAFGTVYQNGKITVDTGAFQGGTTVGLFKIVGRDLYLHVDPGEDAPDYSLLQTLPEYYFGLHIEN